ncbi:MAG: EcsC family protein [Ignavibacteria bacterium]|nr:EcsC family protein [Ignavibacteria bacterium]
MTNEDKEILRKAKKLLENPGLAIKIANIIGKPVEIGMNLLPVKLSAEIGNTTRKALEIALDIAVKTMDKGIYGKSQDVLHKIIVLSTGAAGGFFGAPALIAELPVSTTVMLRSIADIAQSEGEDLNDLKTRLSCLEVFALGGNTGKDDSSETGYFAVRAALSKAVTEAAEFVAVKGIGKESAPALVRFIAQIARRYGVTVSEKLAGQAIPVIGAAGGAVINLIFIDHFQDMARGHFTVRRLEKKYGYDAVKSEYDNL